MRLTFRDACRVAYRRNGTCGLWALWLGTVPDMLKAALQERARQGEILMSRARLIGLAPSLSVLVGLMWALPSIGSLGFLTETLVVILSFPFFLSFIPMLIAVIGIRLRFHPAAGGVGRLGLALSVAGCAGAIAFVLASMLFGGAASAGDPVSWVNYAAVASVLSIRIGYILFGVDALRYRLLPRWNVLPLLLGSTFVLSLPMDWFGVPAFLPMPPQVNVAFLHFVITAACWVLLGVAMMEQAQAPEAVTS
jgi:hypothetical protein